MNATKTTMLMNPVTGSVATEAEWRADFASMTAEEWGSENFDDGGLIEVVENIPGQPGYDPNYGEWREKEDTMTAATTATIIIVVDSRCGESMAFNSMDDFRKAMLACGWTRKEFKAFLEDDMEPAEVYDAEIVRPIDEGGVYVYEQSQRYVYYRVWECGEVEFLGSLEEPAEEEEIDEMLQD